VERCFRTGWWASSCDDPSLCTVVEGISLEKECTGDHSKPYFFGTRDSCLRGIPNYDTLHCGVSNSDATTRRPTGPDMIPTGPDAIPFEYTISARDIVVTVPWGILNYNGKAGYAAGKQIHADIVQAIREGPPSFKEFCGTGDLEADRRECAAFFANVVKETGGMGQFEEKTSSTYCTHNGDGSPEMIAAGTEWPCCVEEDRKTVCTDKSNCPFGCNMHGRGAIQLTWNANYGRFSEFYYGYKEKLLRNPELVEGRGPLGWAASIWFWMTRQVYGGSCPPPKDFSSSLPVGEQSCHEAMHDAGGGGFGQTIRIINGGYEACKKTGVPSSAVKRVEYYLTITTDWQVRPAPGCLVGDEKCDVSGAKDFVTSRGVVGNPQIGFPEDATNCPNCGVPSCTKERKSKWGICGSSGGGPDCPEPLHVDEFTCTK